jgi:hypothetical protein
MSVLDFKEIPQPGTASGEQDAFELFARDFLELLGFKTISGPDRGADGGRDLIVSETRKGAGGETHVRWLVSCKHNAHSGKSVCESDELNILDRVRSKKCTGFILVCSTLPSSGLIKRLEELRPDLDHIVYDRGHIEKELLHLDKGPELAKRHFPVSMRKWRRHGAGPAQVFPEGTHLYCAHCGKDLLRPKVRGNVVLWRFRPTASGEGPRRVDEFYWCCKGECDRSLERKYARPGLIDSWEDIADIAIPLVYAQWMMAVLNEVHRGDVYSDRALEKYKEFMLALYPWVARDIDTEQAKRLKTLMEFGLV